MEIPTKCHDLALKIACDPITEKCVTKECEHCPSLDLKALWDCCEVCFYIWKEGEKYYEKQLTENTGEEVIELLNEQIDYVKVHYYRKRIQDATYREHIKGLKDGELVIHVDCSENYKNKQQSEIKAGYYGQGQFSLFVVVIYMKQHDDTVCKNYALVTRENDHSCNISFGLNNFILSTMQANYDFKTVKLWSDGCASQFFSQFAFFVISKFDHSINIEWNYFEANHRKGFYQIGDVEQEIKTPLDTGSSSSSLRSSNLLVRVAELDYLYK